ncbi:TolC family protein [Altererythrobacter sp. C41]|uniref:TolC family protein n=1 Tax=Altererythrobacter sp. C41 TaxID=2806021 RepID=UPI0019317989|nr:TolC family protein [Altererythrobacter sp. C41]MBM0171407.1 TolC family protein [Altererythrobacter sp. C41]
MGGKISGAALLSVSGNPGFGDNGLGNTNSGYRRFLSFAAAAAIAFDLASAARAEEPVYGPPSQPEASEILGLETPPGIDESLARAAAATLATYPSLSASRSHVRAADYEIEAARWLRFPSVDATVATRDDKFGALRPDITVFQPIWTGGRIAAAGERSTAARAVANAQLEEVSFEILGRLAQAYYEIGRTARLTKIYEESLEEHRRLVESMRRRVEQEVSPRTDLELALTRAAQTEQELALLRTQLGIAQRRFSELSGISGADVVPPTYDRIAHHAVGERAIENAGICNPTVKRLNAMVALAEAERKLSKAEIMPQLGAQYVRDRFGGDQFGVALRAQTNGGLSAFSLAEAAAARRDASQFDAITAQRELREAVSLALIENRTAKSRIDSSARSASSSLNVAQSYLRQFVAGRRTWLDVMNSVREAVTARAALIEAETSAMTSSARIHLQSCGWLPTSPYARSQ